AKIPEPLLPYLRDEFAELQFGTVLAENALFRKVSCEYPASDGLFVRAGTVEGFVNRATHFCVQDPYFVHCFIQGYPSFTSGTEIVGLLLKRLAMSSESAKQIPPHLLRLYCAHYVIPLRLAVFMFASLLVEAMSAVLASRAELAVQHQRFYEIATYDHLEAHPLAEAADGSLTEALRDLAFAANHLRSLLANVQGSARPLKEQLAERWSSTLRRSPASSEWSLADTGLRSSGASSMSRSSIFSSASTLAMGSAPVPLLRLTVIDPLVVAQHLVAIDRTIYVTIGPHELYFAAVTPAPSTEDGGADQSVAKRPGRADLAPGVTALNERFNEVVHIVSSTVMAADTPRARADMIAHWIHVARCCLEYRNLNAANAITASLSSATVYSLRRSWERVPKPSLTQLQSLQHLFSPSANFKVLRSLLGTLGTPAAADGRRPREAAASRTAEQDYCVPWLGVHVREAIQVCEVFAHGGMAPAEVRGGGGGGQLVNFDRCRWLSNITDQTLRFQRRAARAAAAGGRGVWTAAAAAAGLPASARTPPPPLGLSPVPMLRTESFESSLPRTSGGSGGLPSAYISGLSSDIAVVAVQKQQQHHHQPFQVPAWWSPWGAPWWLEADCYEPPAAAVALATSSPGRSSRSPVPGRARSGSGSGPSSAVAAAAVAAAVAGGASSWHHESSEVAAGAQVPQLQFPWRLDSSVASALGAAGSTGQM
ncbi:Ras protein-specific guanine nucleotide-releasing factor, partial [Cladochytrium tenue]